MIGITIFAVIVEIYFEIFQPRPKYAIHVDGYVDPGFESVFKIFRRNFDYGYDVEGASFSVYHKNRTIIDLWGGYADSCKNNTWKRDTMTVTYSTTKAACALCITLLIDRKLLNYDDLVVKYWPEFGQNGKQDINVRMFVSHQAGLALFDEKITYDLIRNHSAMSKVIENQKPNWKIDETKAGYHVLTYGFLIDQLIRRVDPESRGLSQFFAEEIATPYDIEFYIGLPPELESRVARIIPPTNIEFIYGMSDYRFAIALLIFHFKTSDSLLNRALKNPEWLLVDEKGHTVFNDPDAHSLEIGSAMGIGTARALAKMISLMGDDRFINRSTFEMVKSPLFVHLKDQVLTLPMTYGHGFEYSPNAKGSYMIGHSGYGGQNVKYDPQYEIGISYLRNGLSHLNGDINLSYKSLIDTLYDCLPSKQ